MTLIASSHFLALSSAGTRCGKTTTAPFRAHFLHARSLATTSGGSSLFFKTAPLARAFGTILGSLEPFRSPDLWLGSLYYTTISPCVQPGCCTVLWVCLALFHDRPTKRLSMYRRKPVSLDCLQVCFGAVPLMYVETVCRVVTRQLQHMLITGDLCEN